MPILKKIKLKNKQEKKILYKNSVLIKILNPHFRQKGNRNIMYKLSTIIESI